MESKRQKKSASVIQKELAQIFQRHSSEWFSGTFTTVTYVKMTPDLGIARVYLSFLLAKDNEEALQNVEQHASQIRGELGRAIGKQSKKVPELEFFLDTMQDEVDRVEKLFKNIEIPPEEKED